MLEGRIMNRFKRLFRFLAVWCGIMVILSINMACDNKKTAKEEIRQPEPAAVENIMHITTAGREVKFVSFSSDGEKIYSSSWRSMDEFDISHASKKAEYAGEYNGIGWSFFKEKKNKELIVHSRIGKTFRLPSHLSESLFSISDDGRHALLKKDKSDKFTIFDVDKNLEVSSFTLPGNYELPRANFSPDNKYIVLAGFAPEPLIIFDVAKGAKQALEEQSGNVRSFAYTPDSKYLLAGSHYDLKYWDLKTGELIKTFPGEYSKVVWSVDISFDGKFALSGDNSGTVKLWDIQTGKETKIFRGHTRTVNSVAFSPDGKYAVSGSDDGTTRLWDIATGKELAQIISFNDREWVIMTPEGYFNASPHGAKYISVRVGDNLVPVDVRNKNLYEKFLNPERVISIVQGK